MKASKFYLSPGYTRSEQDGIKKSGNSLAVQCLGLSAFTAVTPGSIPGQGTKISQAMWGGQKKKKTTAGWNHISLFSPEPSEAGLLPLC